VELKDTIKGSNYGWRGGAAIINDGHRNCVAGRAVGIETGWLAGWQWIG
jgi:hypothetical protein